MISTVSEWNACALKSKLAQYLSMATIFSNGYIKELDLVAHDKEDIERLIKYMYQGE